jgi:uncharacterized protein YjdB
MAMDIGNAIAVTTLVGFAIQQSLQIIDPVVDLVSSKWIPSPTIWKKTIMGALAVIFGVLVTFKCNIDLFTFVGFSATGFGKILSAVVFSAGTEGANSIQKYLGYAKDAKAAPVVAVSVLPATASLKVGETARLLVAVTGNDPAVDWEIAEPGLGAITAAGTSAGLLTATAAGTCHVSARSRANPAVVGMATITIT